MKSTEIYNEIHTYTKSSFIWKVGKYNLEIIVYVNGIKNYFNHKLSFELTNLDISDLQKNIDVILKIIDRDLINENTEYRENWNWIQTEKLDK